MVPALIKKSIRQFIYCHQHSPGLQPNLLTRWKGKTRLTNSEGAIHEKWLARCSPCAPGFGCEQYTPSHSLGILLPMVSTRQFLCEKMESIKLLWEFEPGLQRWGLTVLTTMLPCTTALRILERTYWYQPNPGLTLDTFLFSDTTSNNFLCPTMPQH